MACGREKCPDLPFLGRSDCREAPESHDGTAGLPIHVTQSHHPGISSPKRGTLLSGSINAPELNHTVLAVVATDASENRTSSTVGLFLSVPGRHVVLVGQHVIQGGQHVVLAGRMWSREDSTSWQGGCGLERAARGPGRAACGPHRVAEIHTPQLHSQDDPVGGGCTCRSRDPEVRLFRKWSNDDGQISGISVQNHLVVKKCAKYLPHSAGHHAARHSCQAQCPLWSTSPTHW